MKFIYQKRQKIYEITFKNWDYILVYDFQWYFNTIYTELYWKTLLFNKQKTIPNRNFRTNKYIQMFS